MDGPASPNEKASSANDDGTNTTPPGTSTAVSSTHRSIFQISDSGIAELLSSNARNSRNTGIRDGATGSLKLYTAENDINVSMTGREDRPRISQPESSLHSRSASPVEEEEEEEEQLFEDELDEKVAEVNETAVDCASSAYSTQNDVKSTKCQKDWTRGDALCPSDRAKRHRYSFNSNNNLDNAARATNSEINQSEIVPSQSYYTVAFEKTFNEVQPPALFQMIKEKENSEKFHKRYLPNEKATRTEKRCASLIDFMFEQERLRSRHVPESIENSMQTEKLSNRDVGVQSDGKVAEMREMSCQTEILNVSDKSDRRNMTRKSGGITVKRSASSELVSSPIPPVLENFGCDGNGLMNLDQLTGVGSEISSEARREPEHGPIQSQSQTTETRTASENRGESIFDNIEMKPNLSDNDCVITRVVEKNSRSNLANEVRLPMHFFEEQQKMFKESQSLAKTLVEVLPQIAKMSSNNSYFAGTMNPFVPFNPILNTMNPFNPAHPMYPNNPNFDNFSRFDPPNFGQNVNPNPTNLTAQPYESTPTPTPTHQNCDRFEERGVSPDIPLRNEEDVNVTRCSPESPPNREVRPNVELENEKEKEPEPIVEEPDDSVSKVENGDEEKEENIIMNTNQEEPEKEERVAKGPIEVISTKTLQKLKNAMSVKLAIEYMRHVERKEKEKKERELAKATPEMRMRLRSSSDQTTTSSGRIVRDSTINRFSISPPPSRTRFSILLNSGGTNPQKKQNGSQKKVVQFSKPMVVGGTKTSSSQQDDTPRRDGKEVQREKSKRRTSSESDSTDSSVVVGSSSKKRKNVVRADDEPVTAKKRARNMPRRTAKVPPVPSRVPSPKHTDNITSSDSETDTREPPARKLRGRKKKL